MARNTDGAVFFEGPSAEVGQHNARRRARRQWRHAGGAKDVHEPVGSASPFAFDKGVAFVVEYQPR